MDELIELIKKGWSIQVNPQVKRTDGPQGRDFYIRYVWTAIAGSRRIEADWEGFDTPQEAFTDMIENIKMTQSVMDMNEH